MKVSSQARGLLSLDRRGTKIVCADCKALNTRAGDSYFCPYDGGCVKTTGVNAMTAMNGKKIANLATPNKGHQCISGHQACVYPSGITASMAK